MKGDYYRISKIKVLGILMISFVLICSVLGQAHAAIPATERNALIAIYNSMGGASWTDSTGWNGAAGTECNWFGVTCNGSQTTVEELVLTNNNLNGTIPSALGALVNLRVLYLDTPDSGTLTGPIPSEIGSLVQLRDLRLGYNQLDGEIPIGPGLDNLVNIRTLWLGHNRLSGNIPPELGNLVTVEYFSLRDNELRGTIPPELGNLVNAIEIYLDVNMLTGNIPTELGNIPTMARLYLNSNQLRGGIPAVLGSLTEMEGLYLYDNFLTGPIPPELGNLTKLRRLRLFDNNLNGSIPPELGNLTSLQNLSLANNLLTGPIPPELGNLSALETLFLYWNELSGEIPGSLINLTSLTDDGSNICQNQLYTTDTALRDFLIAKTDPDWNTCQAAAPNIDVAPTTADYGNVVVNASFAKTYTVANVAPATAILDVSAITVAGNSDYSLNLNPSTNPCGSASPNIPIGGSCNVEVTFSPSSTGIKNATLNISSNDPDSPSIDVDLTGTGVDPADTDNDGLPDQWEQQIIDADPNDPIVTIQDVDPNDDFDNDGLTNQQEYEDGSMPANARPDAPELDTPIDDETDVSLTPQLTTMAFSDPNGDGHGQTQWQVSTDDTFADPAQMVVDTTSDMHLTMFDVPYLSLEINQEYFWRVRFIDSAGQVSAWSGTRSFTTITECPTDTSAPYCLADAQVIDCVEVFGEGNVPANTVCADPGDGNTIAIEGSTNVTGVEAFAWVDPMDLPEGPTGVDMNLGLINFKALCNPGDTIEIIYHTTEPIPDGAKWWKYDPDLGWYDYTAHVKSIAADRKSAVLEFKDGDFGDIDDAENGCVIDPSGPGVAAGGGGGGTTPTSGGGGGGGGCFIVSAKDALPIPGNMLTLILLLGSGIIVLAGFNNKQSQR